MSRFVYYGLLQYNNSYNLGDEIQSIAASQFLPSIDYLVDRDTGVLSQSSSNIIKTIYNGWFDGNYSKFPPPENIDPLFVSFHINETEHITDTRYNILEKKKFIPLSSYKEYFKKYEPIGCRDLHTLKMLQNNGIKSYFSGCLTLTLTNKFTERNDDILIIDVHINDNKLLKQIIPSNILNKATYISQAIEELLPHNEKIKLAQKFLDMLAKAKLVITNRLHTTLPCLAYKTPVIFISSDLNDVRFSGLLKFFKAYTLGDKLDVDLDTYKNTYSEEFYDLISNIKQTVTSWIITPPIQSLLGKSIFSVCMNRNNHLEKSLPTWLNANPDEIVLIDWGSKEKIKSIVEKYDTNNKVKLIEVNNISKWVLSRSFNLAARMTRYEHIFKVDADTLVNKDFFSYHNLEHAPCFFAGDWTKSRNTNEQHTNGIVYMNRTKFLQIKGYNEYIVTYGYDDCDLYNRLKLKGLNRLLLNLDTISHIEHDNVSRVKNQETKNRLDIEIEKNRLISDLVVWDGPFSEYNITKVNDTYYKAMFLKSVILDPIIENIALQRAVKNRSYTDKMSGYKLYINVRNGLGNRLRALASAYNIAKYTNRKLVIIWIPDFHCEAKFTDLFVITQFFKNASFVYTETEIPFAEINNYESNDKSNEIKRYEFNESGSGDMLKYNYETNKGQYIDDRYPGDIYVSSACVLNNKHTNWYKENAFLRHLQLTEELEMKIYDFEVKYNIYNAIGVHIRMGQDYHVYPHDNIEGYNEESKKSCQKWRAASNWETFVVEMRRILKTNSNQLFFICCDNQFIYNEIIEEIGYNNICFVPKNVYDRSLKQIESAVMDMYLLSRCKTILGSNWSSFSEVAHRLSNKDIKYAGVDFFPEKNITSCC